MSMAVPAPEGIEVDAAALTEAVAPGAVEAEAAVAIAADEAPVDSTEGGVSGASDRCCRLPGELNIYTAADTHALLSAWCAVAAGSGEAADAQAPLQLDAGEVFEVDGAGVQLLLAADRSLQARARAWAFAAVSQTLAEALEDLGLADWLAAHRA